MHDTLHYMQEDPIDRRYHHDQMTFGLIYAFSERFLLPISHDEVVHGKGSLLGRMPGDDWQRFANLRAYLASCGLHPGKKMLFMGCEFGQPTEWNHDAELPWHLLEQENHRGIHDMVRALNALLRENPALYQRDFDASGFAWVVGDDREQSIFAFLRFGDANTPPVLAVCNFTPIPRYGYRIGAPTGEWNEIFNSDAACFGGANIGNAGTMPTAPIPAHGHADSLTLTLPPLAVVLLRQA